MYYFYKFRDLVGEKKAAIKAEERVPLSEIYERVGEVLTVPILDEREKVHGLGYEIMRSDEELFDTVEPLTGNGLL